MKEQHYLQYVVLYVDLLELLQVVPTLAFNFVIPQYNIKHCITDGCFLALFLMQLCAQILPYRLHAHPNAPAECMGVCIVSQGNEYLKVHD